MENFISHWHGKKIKTADEGERSPGHLRRCVHADWMLTVCVRPFPSARPPSPELHTARVTREVFAPCVSTVHGGTRVTLHAGFRTQPDSDNQN